MIDSYSGLLNSLSNWWGSRSAKGMQIKKEGIEYSGDMTQVQIRTLNEVKAYNYRLMSPLRVSRAKMRKQYFGCGFGEDGGVEKTIVLNKMQEAVRIWLQNLVTGDPRVAVSTEFPSLRDFAWEFEHAVNMHLVETRIGEAFAQGVFDSFFGPGIFKTALGSGAKTVINDDGQWIDPGVAFTSAISLDNFVADMSANSPESIEFLGDRYLRPKDWVKKAVSSAKEGDYSVVEDLRSSDMPPEDMITGHDQSEQHRLYEMAWVWDIYLAQENLMVTIPDDCDTPIAVWEWDGPEGGPYDILNLYPHSGSPFSPAPGMAIYEMHMFANEIYRKLGRQTSRQKSILGYEYGAEKGAEAARNSSDGDVVGFPAGTLAKMAKLSYGGANPMGGEMLSYTLQQIDTAGGNLSSLGGLGPSAQTFSGDKMINENASSLIRFLETALAKTATRILKKHSWWVWTEDIRSYAGEAELIPNTGVQIPWSFTPEERSGDFLDFNFTIAPYSFKARTPDENAMLIMQMWNNMIMPSAEILMQSGAMPNAVGVVEYLCKQYDVPVDILISTMDPAMQDMVRKSMTEAPARMKQSHTVNERVSRPGTTPKGNENEFMKAMTGASQESGVQMMEG